MQGVQGIHVTQSVDDIGDIVLYVISKAPGVLSNASGVEESKLDSAYETFQKQPQLKIT